MTKGRGKSSNKAAESASRCGKSRKEAAELAIRSNISSNNEFKSPIRCVLSRKSSGIANQRRHEQQKGG